MDWASRSKRESERIPGGEEEKAGTPPPPRAGPGRTGQIPEDSGRARFPNPTLLPLPHNSCMRSKVQGKRKEKNSFNLGVNPFGMLRENPRPRGSEKG